VPKKTTPRSRIGYFSPDPDRSGYENLVGTCRSCDTEIIVNRATDLRGTYPSSHVIFKCPNCGRQARPSGDIANHPVDQFVYDAYEPMRNRRYMQAVLLIAQSLEVALSMCVRQVILTKLPKPKRLRKTSPFLKVGVALDKTLDTLTLGTLRIIVANLAFEASPTSIPDALTAIKGLDKLRGKLPTDTDIAGLADPDLQEAVGRLVGIPTFVKLRNKMVHEALRPTQHQAEWCMENIPELTRALLRGFGIARGQLVMPPTVRPGS
jgi:RNase P subunit RPR2